jgi:hypothetical protein
MKIEIKLDKQAIRDIENAARQAAVEAMEKLRKDLNNSETMPFDTGDMQNNQTFVSVEGEDTVNGEDVYSVSLVTGSPQARRLYYHPEYQFQQGHNDNAGGLWLEPYINGDKKDFAQTEFTKIFKEKSGI